jgi:hypothetical protein
MADFVFKNLSVKLLPAGDDASPDCEPCTDLCTGCTALNTDCGDCTNCTDATCQVCTCGFDTDVLIVSEPEFDAAEERDLRSELAAHRTHLRLAVAQIEQLQRKPQSVEEIDNLKSKLQETMAELDERRAELEADKGPGAA